jgi:molybdenum cofactor synthesis domain-containing protein
MEITRALQSAAANSEIDLVVTTGGTGVAPRDVTPEATEEVSDRLIPGIAELMRRTSAGKTPFAFLSRAVAGIRGKTLILNLPGSPGGVRDCLEAVIPLISHAVGLMREETTTHRQS